MAAMLANQIAAVLGGRVVHNGAGYIVLVDDREIAVCFYDYVEAYSIEARQAINQIEQENPGAFSGYNL